MNGRSDSIAASTASRARVTGSGDPSAKAPRRRGASPRRCRRARAAAAGARAASTRRGRDAATPAGGTTRRRAAPGSPRRARPATRRSATRLAGGAAARRAPAAAGRSRSRGRAAPASRIGDDEPDAGRLVVAVDDHARDPPAPVDDAHRALGEARLAPVGAHAVDEELDRARPRRASSARRRASRRRAAARRRTRGSPRRARRRRAGTFTMARKSWSRGNSASRGVGSAPSKRGSVAATRCVSRRSQKLPGGHTSVALERGVGGGVRARELGVELVDDAPHLGELAVDLAREERDVRRHVEARAAARAPGSSGRAA